MKPVQKWADSYIREMKKRDVPLDWQRAAKYHLGYIHHKPVTEVRILGWYPRHVDLKAKIIDEADVWCSAKVNDEVYGVMIEMAPTKIGHTFFPGTPGKSGPPLTE